ncbi:MAG: hypothetical protein DBX47_02890 [Clostridiales bacterium]|nr:MAG: hypothetical protein DBX47_02890 [Clostridiales bacterium]
MNNLTEVFNKIGEIFQINISQPEQVATGLAVVLMVISLCNCFFGYRLFRFWSSLAGFFIGFLLGFIVTGLVYKGENSTVYAIIMGVVVAVICSIFAFKVYKLGLFIWSLSMVYSLGLTLLPIDSNIIKNILSVVLGIIVAVFVVKFQYAWIIGTTSISGGFNAAGYFVTLFSFAVNWPVYVVGAVLAVAGFLFQFMFNPKNRTKKRRRTR